jgi:hypothetical protein
MPSVATWQHAAHLDPDVRRIIEVLTDKTHRYKETASSTQAFGSLSHANAWDWMDKSCTTMRNHGVPGSNNCAHKWSPRP